MKIRPLRSHTTHDMARKEKAFPCLFERCKSEYEQLRNLKTHLLTVRGSGFDEFHPQGNQIWADLDAQQFLVRYSRPGLAPEEKKRRRYETQHRSYQKHKTSILEQQRQKREKYYENFDLTSKLALQFSDVRNRVLQNVSLLKEIYGTDSSGYHLSTFVDVQSGISISTFPRLVVYFLPVSELPPVATAVPSITPIVDVIPGSRHYRQVSLLTHPDKFGEEGIQQKLNDGWRLWEDVIGNEALRDVVLFDYEQDEEIGAFKVISSDHAKLAKMFLEYLYASSQAAELLNPVRLCLNRLHQLLREAQEVDGILGKSRDKDGQNTVEETGNEAGDEPVGKLISKALELEDPREKRRKRKRRRCEEISDPNGHNSDGNDVSAQQSSGDSSKESGTIDSMPHIDPQLSLMEDSLINGI